ncbi:MAG: DedA family protein [Pyrinomonadaceae bacterium]|nr:DedA family protein [Pyrinomonadaceae bacterium]
MTELALEWFAAYGSPIYLLILGLSSFGIPMPVKLLMLVVGATVQQGEMSFAEALAIGSLGATIGDQAGYFVGRSGGRAVVERVTAKVNGAEMLAKAERFSDRWGLLAIFFSRWLITPVGPWLNLISGSTRFSWLWFTIVGTLGETLWVLLYVLIGIYFADSIQATADFLTSLSWALFGIFIAAILGWKIFQFFSHDEEGRAETEE